MKQNIVGSLMVVLLAVSLAAQPPAAEPAEIEKAKQEREKNALRLLDELLAEAQSLKLLENRAYVQIIAADLLWTKDEARARSLVQAAAADVAQIMSGIESDDPMYHSRLEPANQLRYQLLQTIARRDAQLALDFLRATRPPKPSEQAPYAADPEAQMEAMLATQVAQTDPKRAAQIAEESMEKGLPYNLWETISQLQAKDPEAAKKLASKLLTKIKSEDLSKNHQAVNVASNVLYSMNSQVKVQPGTGQPALFSEPEQKEFVEAIAAAALKGYETSAEGGAHQLAQTLQQTMPLLEKYAPTQALALRRKLPTQPAATARNKAYEEFSQLQQKGTIEQLLAFAKTAPADLSYQVYQQAAGKAAQQGDADRARSIINTYAPANQRRGMLENIDQGLLWNALNANKLDEVRRMLAGLPNGERKAGTLFQLAENAFGKGDKQMAREWLEEARTSLGSRVETYNHVSTYLRLANSLARIDAERSAEMLTPLVTRMNALLAASEVLDEFEQRRGFQNGEMRLQGGGGMLQQVLRQFAETLAIMASSDFTRAQSITDQFERSEARLLARLGMVQMILRNQGVGIGVISRPTLNRRLTPIR